VRLEHVEREVMTRVVEGTASSTDNSLLAALTSRDQLLGNDGTSAWCPWWWSSSWYGLGNRVEGVAPTAVLHPLPTSCHSTSDHGDARQEANQQLPAEAEEFITAQAEFVALPQLDGTDDSSLMTVISSLMTVTATSPQILQLEYITSLVCRGCTARCRGAA